MKRSPRGMTLLEVLIAIFIFLVGIVGVLAAVPVGISNATLVIFQDASIHLSASKFAEFRRDEVNPAVDLQDGSAYMGSFQEPSNGSAEGFHDFSHGSGGRYEHFDDIDRYEWKVDQKLLKPVGVGKDDQNNIAPVVGSGDALNVSRVCLVIHLKGTTRYMRFTQYMLGKGQS
jgi:prepilin-type N-terminal cleavage/methylation domain-containing protein